MKSPNLERLKAQQAALQAHLSARKQLPALAKAFVESCPQLCEAIKAGFARLGLQAAVPGYAYLTDDDHLPILPFGVSIPPVKRRVDIAMPQRFEFDGEHLRSEFKSFSVLGAPNGVEQPQPIALPVVLIVNDPDDGNDRSAKMWWHGAHDNERLAAIVVDMYMGKGGSNCFVATVIFGEGSAEVAILRKWRDERLSKSIVGRTFVKFYYRIGPRCSVIVQRSNVITSLARSVLLTVCRRLRHRILRE